MAEWLNSLVDRILGIHRLHEADRRHVNARQAREEVTEQTERTVLRCKLRHQRSTRAPGAP